MMTNTQLVETKPRKKESSWAVACRKLDVGKPSYARNGSSEDYVKKGQPPSMPGSNRRPGGRRNISTSDPLANWGRRVSNLVDTTTVLERWGSVCRAIVDMILCNSLCTSVALQALWQLCCLCHCCCDSSSTLMQNPSATCRSRLTWRSDCFFVAFSCLCRRY